MPVNITYLHKRSMLDKLSAKERTEVLRELIKNDITLTETEEKYLSNHDMKIYVNKLLQKASHLTPYELKFTDDTEKEIYIYGDKRLEILFPIINSLDDKWRQTILAQAVFTNKGLTDEIFSSLTDKDKRYYANLAIVNSAYFSPLQLSYLTSKNQKSIIDQLMRRGEAFSKEQIDAITPENKKYYKKRISENPIGESIRRLIRKIINETVSPPGTVFGPYHDEVVLSKDTIKPQYFSIALNRANKICSNPEVSSQEIDCPIDYSIEKTIHAAERQFRHIGDTIEDDQIKRVVSRGIDKLVKLLLSNGIKVGDKVHIKDRSSNLNIVLSVRLERETKTESIINFSIVTVMNNKTFFTGNDTKGPILV